MAENKFGRVGAPSDKKHGVSLLNNSFVRVISLLGIPLLIGVVFDSIQLIDQQFRNLVEIGLAVTTAWVVISIFIILSNVPGSNSTKRWLGYPIVCVVVFSSILLAREVVFSQPAQDGKTNSLIALVFDVEPIVAAKSTFYVDEIKWAKAYDALVDRGFVNAGLMPEHAIAQISSNYSIPENRMMWIVPAVLKLDLVSGNFDEAIFQVNKVLDHVLDSLRIYGALPILAEGVDGIDTNLSNAVAAFTHLDRVDVTWARNELRLAREKIEDAPDFKNKAFYGAILFGVESKLAQADVDIDEATLLVDKAIDLSESSGSRRNAFIWQKANILYEYGRLVKDPNWLLKSQEAINLLTGLTAGDDDSKFRADIKFQRGLIAMELYSFDKNERNFNEAVVAFQECLADYIELGYSVKSSNVSNIKFELAESLRQLGSLNDDQAMIAESISLYDSVLKNIGETDNEIRQGEVLIGMGEAYHELGLSSDNGFLESSSYYDQALLSFSREKYPHMWAKVNFYYGVLLLDAGLELKSTKLLNLGVGYMQGALSETSRLNNPYLWADMHNGLGRLFFEIAIEDKNTELLEQAAKSFRSALEEWTREAKPDDWVEARKNLALTLSHQGFFDSDEFALKEAITIYKSALEEWTRSKDPEGWAYLHKNLGESLGALGLVLESEVYIREAIVSLRLALEETPKSVNPQNYEAMTLYLEKVEKYLQELQSK